MADRSKFEINGIINTSNNVLSNIELLASSAGSFITWDSQLGQWAVIVNETGTSVKSFDDSNILGAINVSGTGVSELYNSVQIAYPHKDLRDATDYVTVSIPEADRFPQEIDNQLQITLDTINNPIQAQILASQELKQNRVDKIVQFRSDYTANGLKAGDLIDITNTVYGYTNKVFRIIQIEEEDTDEGAIIYSITGLEYDANVYTTTNLEYNFRTTVNSIPSRITNEAIQQSDEADFGGTIAKLAGANALLGIVNGLFKRFVTADPETGVLTEDIQFNNEDTQKLMEAGAKKPSLTHAPANGPTAQGDGSLGDPIQLCPGQSTTLSVSHDCEICFLTTPDYEYDYTITGLQVGEVDVDLEGTLTMSGANGSLTFTVDNISGDKTFNVQVGGNTTYYRVYDEPSEYVQGVTATPSSITEGQSTTINVATVGKTNGDTLNYTISGNTGSISTALTGTVTVTSNTASLTINTTDDSAFGATETCTITFTPTAENSCTIASNSVELTITNNATTGPQPPADTNCEYVKVPVVWCARYDGTDGEAKSLSQKAWAMLPVAQAGEATVALPTSVSVTKGSPSTVSVNSTVDIASSGSMGGVPYQVLTSFNNIATNGIITGTTTTVYGYPFTDVAETSIGDMSNISSSTPSDGQVLVWTVDGGIGQWKPTSKSVISNLSDTAPTDKQTLVWNATLGEWVPGRN